MPTPGSYKSLDTLLDGIDYTVSSQEPCREDDIFVSEISCDSRTAGPGSMFVALRGVHFDGHDFIKAAVAAGCKVILCERESVPDDLQGGSDCIFVLVENSGSAYAEIAANFFDRPGAELKSIGITGTNGKTTVTYLVEHVLVKAGKSVGVIGTVNNRYTASSGKLTVLPTLFTTPEAFLLQKVLREMVDAGVEYLVMEVSSHALKQARVGTMLFDVAVFTNLTRDHLDYHLDMDDYFDSKTLLFSKYLSKSGTAVLQQPRIENSEEDWLGKLAHLVRDREIHCMSWGKDEDSELRLINATQDLSGLSVDFDYQGKNHRIKSPLVGMFNTENLLNAVGICLALGITCSETVESLSDAQGAPGRVERVETGDGWPAEDPLVLVDYAHTPDALEKVLSALSQLPHEELFCVFGCGGDRDRGKRPQMARIAARYSDVVIVTDDNPRSENPESIIAEVVAGFAADTKVFDAEWLDNRSRGTHGAAVVRTRDKAIKSAVQAARPGDVVLIAGKGHEPYQITPAGKHFFDDRLEAAKQLFAWRKGLVQLATEGVSTDALDCTEPLGDIVTDSRIKSRKSIFVALKGENHDAHAYAAQAAENGAACLVLERSVDLPDHQKDVCQIIVPDTLKALGDLAAYRRKAVCTRYGQPVIGLTGSCGKTTVKEMIAAVLARMWPAGEFNPENCILKTQGNFNNLIGVPLTMLPCSPLDRALVVEMGMNQPGELRRLGEMTDPDVSCILNVHGAHLEGLATIEGVARAKEELFQATRPDAEMIINLDDPLVKEMAGRYAQKKITFSVRPPEDSHQPDVWVSGIALSSEGHLKFTIHSGELSKDVVLNTVGMHNVTNGLATAAITLSVGADLDQIAAGLSDFRPPDKRLQVVTAPCSAVIINDTYNANPASMAAGLCTLADMQRARKTAIIGDMLELGEAAVQAHYDIGRLAAELQIGQLVTIGQYSDAVADGARDGGMLSEKIAVFPEKVDGENWLKEQLHEERFGQDDVILVKASRGRRFETIVEILVS